MNKGLASLAKDGKLEVFGQKIELSKLSELAAKTISVRNKADIDNAGNPAKLKELVIAMLNSTASTDAAASLGLDSSAAQKEIAETMLNMEFNDVKTQYKREIPALYQATYAGQDTGSFLKLSGSPDPAIKLAEITQQYKQTQVDLQTAREYIRDTFAKSIAEAAKTTPKSREELMASFNKFALDPKGPKIGSMTAAEINSELTDGWDTVSFFSCSGSSFDRSRYTTWSNVELDSCKRDVSRAVDYVKDVSYQSLIAKQIESYLNVVTRSAGDTMIDNFAIIGGLNSEMQKIANDTLAKLGKSNLIDKAREAEGQAYSRKEEYHTLAEKKKLASDTIVKGKALDSLSKAEKVAMLRVFSGNSATEPYYRYQGADLSVNIASSPNAINHSVSSFSSREAVIVDDHAYYREVPVDTVITKPLNKIFMAGIGSDTMSASRDILQAPLRKELEVLRSTPGWQNSGTHRSRVYTLEVAFETEKEINSRIEAERINKDLNQAQIKLREEKLRIRIQREMSEFDKA